MFKDAVMKSDWFANADSVTVFPNWWKLVGRRCLINGVVKYYVSCSLRCPICNRSFYDPAKFCSECGCELVYDKLESWEYRNESK